MEEAYMLGITELHLFVLLPHMLSGEAASQHRATVRGSRAEGVTNWPEEPQYFLPTYAITNTNRLAEKTTHASQIEKVIDKVSHVRSCCHSTAHYGHTKSSTNWASA